MLREDTQRTDEVSREEVSLPHVSVWERVSFGTTRFVLRWFARIFGLGGLYQLGRAFATVEWAINRRRRRRFSAAMMKYLGPDQAKGAVREATLRYFVRMRTDKMFYLVFDHFRREEISKRFRIINRELLDDALSTGRGVYIAMSHHGSHHVALVCLQAQGYSVGGVREPNEGAIRRYMQSKLALKPWARVRYFHNDVFPRQILRWLRNPNLLVSAMDTSRTHSLQHKTVDVELFGQKRPVLRGPLDMANRAGAVTVQAFVRSRPGFHYEFEVYGPLVDLQSGGDVSDERIHEAIRSYAERIERFTRNNPCHISRI